MSIKHMTEGLLKNKAVLVVFLLVSIVLNVYFFSRSNRNESVVRNYYLTCVNHAQFHIATVDRMLGIDFKSPGANGLFEKDYEKYYLIAKEFEVIGDDIGLFNIYFTHIEKSKTAYFGRIDTSRIFDCYRDVITEWAYAVKNNTADNKPTKAKMQALQQDIKELTKIFQVYMGIDYRNEEKMENMNYGDFYNRLRKWVNSTKLEEIKKQLKMYSIMGS